MSSYKFQSSRRLGGRKFINFSGARFGGGSQSEKWHYRRGELQRKYAVAVSTNETGLL